MRRWGEGEELGYGRTDSARKSVKLDPLTSGAA